MKTIIIAILFSSFIWIVNAQIFCIGDSAKYLLAYDYIQNDSVNNSKNADVSDSLVCLNIGVFWRELKSPDDGEKDLFSRMYNMYQNADFSLNLSFLKRHTNKDSKSIVFFSPVINDSILCADLLKKKSCWEKDQYSRIAMQNRSFMYLFLFDSNGSIKSVARKEMIYD